MNTYLLSIITVALTATGVLGVPSFRERTVCEGKKAYLKCRSGYAISVLSAKYGRSDYKTCPHRNIRATQCSSPNSLKMVRRSCNGRQACSVLASNNVFGDPCRGTYKYLSVRYVCKKIMPGGIRRSVTCENTRKTLFCERGRVLDIKSANYGRSDRNTCPHKKIRTTSCSSGTSLYKVRQQCQGKPRCQVYSSNKVFGDPCRGTYKYLDVRYSCVANKPKTYSRVICESSSSTIKCPASTVLKIISATYGRTDGYTCPRYGKMRNQHCSAPGCIDSVRKYCQGKRSCMVKASNSIFGDPCVGTYKYLKLKYQCIYGTRY